MNISKLALSRSSIFFNFITDYLLILRIFWFERSRPNLRKFGIGVLWTGREVSEQHEHFCLRIVILWNIRVHPMKTRHVTVT